MSYLKLVLGKDYYCHAKRGYSNKTGIDFVDNDYWWERLE